jgi:hypothetical protein
MFAAGSVPDSVGDETLVSAFGGDGAELRPEKKAVRHPPPSRFVMQYTKNSRILQLPALCAASHCSITEILYIM